MVYSKIKNTISRYNMINCGDSVLLGVSGGADSMLMLNFFNDTKKEYGITLKVAHIEHGLRGQESKDDAKFVEDFCKENDIEFRLLSIDAAKLAKKANMGFEEYSRKARYDFFSSLNCDKTATAHSSSDNIETALFRLIRGTSLKGLSAISPVRDNIIRPLIELTSDEIREYCNDNNIKYRIDSTNSDNNYSRNYIRNVIIPDMKKLNPSFDNAASRLISIVRDDEEYLEKAADELYNNSLCDNKFNIDRLLNQSPALVSRVITKYLDKNDIKTDYIHINEVINLINKDGITQINGDVFVFSKENKLTIINKRNEEKNKKTPQKYDKIVVSMDEFLNIRELSQYKIDFYCDFDKINGKTLLRNRQEGDEITIAGRNCTKSLKKYFNELKIPVENRDNITVITDEKGVIGVIGYAVSNRVVTDSSTKKVLIFIPLEDD